MRRNALTRRGRGGRHLSSDMGAFSSRTARDAERGVVATPGVHVDVADLARARARATRGRLQRAWRALSSNRWPKPEWALAAASEDDVAGAGDAVAAFRAAGRGH